MKIGLIQVDGKIPNLALMQIAAYHRAKGDDPFLVWLDPDGQARKRKKKAFERGMFDDAGKFYASTLFGFNREIVADIRREIPDVVIGGTGIDYATTTIPETFNKLSPEIAAFSPQDAWFLYPSYPAHVGFSQKGCRLKCEHCCVPRKEPGKPWVKSAVGALLANPNGDDRLILLDNDFFGGPSWKDNLLEIQSRKLNVSFCQGLNIRIITDEQAGLLAETQFYNPTFTKHQVTFAWDITDHERAVKRGFDKCVAAGIKPYQMRFYVFVGFNSTEEQDMYRIETIRSWGSDPYVMPYNKEDAYQKRLARWVNQTAVFKTVKWADYKKPTTKKQIGQINRRIELPILFG